MDRGNTGAFRSAPVGVRPDALKRLNYIDGHLSGIRRMVEQNKDCVDILKQTFAVRRAIQNMEMTLLEGHPALMCNRGSTREP